MNLAGTKIGVAEKGGELGIDMRVMEEREGKVLRGEERGRDCSNGGKRLEIDMRFIEEREGRVLMKERKHEKHKFISFNSKNFHRGSHASCKIYFYRFDFNDKQHMHHGHPISNKVYLK